MSADWRCKQCSHSNPEEEDFCDQCFAPRRASGAPRETCRTCLHRHGNEKSCHVYVLDNKAWNRKLQRWNQPRKGKKLSDQQDIEGDSDRSADVATSSSGSSASGASTGSTDQDAGSENDQDSAEGNDSGSDGNEDDDTDDEDEDDDDGDTGEGEESNSSGTSGSSSDEGDVRGGQPKTKKGVLSLGDRLAAKAVAIAKKAGQALAVKPTGGRPVAHEAAPWAKATCFQRCNCDHGVPSNSTAFAPLQDGRMVAHEVVGSVTIRTEPPVGEELAFENRAQAAVMPPPLDALRLFLEYTDPKTVARCAHVSIGWHQECYERDETGRPVHPTYVGVHMLELESALDAFEDKIDALFFHQPPSGSAGQLFTSGQRSVRAWKRIETQVEDVDDAAATSSQGWSSRTSGGSGTQGDGAVQQRTSTVVSWQLAGVAVRDTAPFTTIQPVNNSIICCSSNGSIREWSLAHDVKNVRFLAQMWEHNGYITGVAFSAPSVGFCKPHGSPGHCCFMYSVSDDRYLKVWDLSTKECLHTVKPRVPECGTLQSVARSDFHLYAGSSNGRIFVFALGRVCQRPEKHRCHLHDKPRWFCEQEAFNHGNEPVQHMVCGGVGSKFKYLFTAARDGTIKVWKIPKQSFGHRMVCTFKQHTRAITALSVTGAHLFSASDEGHVRIWSLGTLCLQRVVRQQWRIKCIWVSHAPKDSPDAGNGCLFLGLATGRVLAYPMTDSV